MGELTDKAKGLGNEIAGNVKQAAGRASNKWHIQSESFAQERNAGRRTFLGKVTGSSAS